tara:strand:- start:30544 stop:31275 length:732 start_codon:yes stop_codon:yes gene_type:complete
MRLIGILLLAVLVVGCDDSKIKFSEPQPKKVKMIEKIPNNLIGDYTLCSDTSIIGHFDKEYPFKKEKDMKLNAENIVQITNKGFYNKIKGEITLEFKKSDSLFRTYESKKMMFDTLVDEYYNHPNYTYDITFFNDTSITFKFSLVDTMFYVSKKNIIKIYKGDPYLNINYGVNKWLVFQIKKNKNGTLFFNSITKSDDYVLRRIMKLNNENYTADSLTPSKKSFSQFIKMEGFERGIKLQKVK